MKRLCDIITGGALDRTLDRIDNQYGPAIQTAYDEEQQYFTQAREATDRSTEALRQAENSEGEDRRGRLFEKSRTYAENANALRGLGQEARGKRTRLEAARYATMICIIH